MVHKWPISSGYSSQVAVDRASTYSVSGISLILSQEMESVQV